MTVSLSLATTLPSSSACNPQRFGLLYCSRQFINLPHHCVPTGIAFCSRNWNVNAGKISASGAIKAVNGERARFALKTGSSSSPWNEKPFEILPNGKKLYFDEQDIVTFLSPPKQLIPLEPISYNPATYLWKKIDDVPEERRHRLMYLLNPRQISAAWEMAGGRYNDAKLAERSSSSLLSSGHNASALEFWYCRKSGGQIPFGLIKYFKKALFCKDGQIYGRLIGTSLLGKLATSSPLYFTVKPLQEVMPTEQPCDVAYEFGDGLLDLDDYPEGFPRATKHPWPFSDQIVIYIRHLGPGVMVGQAWQEGLELEQVPKKLCTEILMVKDYAAVSGNDNS